MNTMQWLYLLINFLTVIIPFLFSFHGKLRFNKYFRQFFLANIIVAVLFIIWDIMFTARGVWGFNPLYVTGISIFNLPIEEVLFFICIPFACVFTYHSLSLFWKIKWSPAAENTVVSILAAGLLLAGLFNYDKLYTVVTFIGTALALVALRYYFKVTWLPRFLMVYLVLLIPFFIVNGVLTGTAIEGEVVWYDDAENLGIRLGTIPVEDIIYGFLLIMMNVFFFERFKK